MKSDIVLRRPSPNQYLFQPHCAKSNVRNLQSYHLSSFPCIPSKALFLVKPLGHRSDRSVPHRELKRPPSPVRLSGTGQRGKHPWKRLTACWGGKRPLALCQQKHPSHTQKGLCCCTDSGRAAGRVARREAQRPQPCSLSPLHPPKGKLDPSGEIIASLSSPSARTVPGAQLRAHVTPPGRHKPRLSCPKC